MRREGGLFLTWSEEKGRNYLFRFTKPEFGFGKQNSWRRRISPPYPQEAG